MSDPTNTSPSYDKRQFGKAIAAQPEPERDYAARLHAARVGCGEHGSSADDAATVHRAQVRRLRAALE